MRRLLIPTITLVLCLGTLFGIVPRRLIAKGASIELPLPSKFLTAVSADKQVASPRGKSLADEAQLLLTDITFRGTAIEFVTLFDMPGQWRVSVSEVLSGPPISGEVSVFVDTFEPPCLGHEDTSIEPGDTVEVRGMFHDGPVITICESNSYYIVKLVGEEIKFRGTTVSLDDLGLYWSVQVDEVISGPDLTGQTVDVHVVNYDPVPCAGTVDPNIVEGDRVEVYGRYEDYNRVYVCELENYYIRRECSTHHFRGEVIQRSDDLGPTEYGFVIRVTGILTETPDFDINMGDEVYVWAEEGAIGTPLPGIGDIVEVKGRLRYGVLRAV